LSLKNGIPSHDTINRVFEALNTNKFEKCFIAWTQNLKETGAIERVIAIDGKTVRGSKDSFHHTRSFTFCQCVECREWFISWSNAINTLIRSHWSVENNLHWTLDMVFGEDGQRKRAKHAAKNFAIVRKIALNLLKKDTSKGSLRTKRLKAAWNKQFLINLLKI
jgi:predicted transposase YbfD/YdcC